MLTRFCLSSPVGLLGVSIQNEALRQIEYLPGDNCCPEMDGMPEGEVTGQLERYFEDGGYRFSLPLRLSGTEFQQRVWQALCRIEPGEVRTYGQIARDLNSSPRAVGNACRRNPVPIVVPCHRVVAANGIGGYSGDTDGGKLAVKRWLLAHEGVCL